MEGLALLMRVLIPLSELLGLDTPAKLWYLLLALFVVAFLLRSLNKIRDSHAKIYESIKNLSSSVATLDEKMNGLREKQGMQKAYVTEQEARYNEAQKQLLALHYHVARLKSKID